MLTNKLKLFCALAMLFGCVSIASAGYGYGYNYGYHYDTRCCCGGNAYTKDAYSKFNTCCVIPEYPQQRFPLPSP